MAPFEPLELAATLEAPGVPDGRCGVGLVPPIRSPLNHNTTAFQYICWSAQEVPLLALHQKHIKVLRFHSELGGEEGDGGHAARVTLCCPSPPLRLSHPTAPTGRAPAMRCHAFSPPRSSVNRCEYDAVGTYSSDFVCHSNSKLTTKPARLRTR
jgi:hypothetical protein